MAPDAYTAGGTYEKMATDWYYQIMNDIVGPLTSSQLVACVRTGKVKEDTLIRKDDSQWVPAHRVNGLLEAVQDNRSRRICPYCGHNVDAPPTTCRGCYRKLVLSLNSRLTAIDRHEARGAQAARDRAAELEAIRHRSDRRDVVRYLVLLVLWLGVLLVAPYLIYLATTGRLFFAGDLTVVSVLVVAALIGGVYYLISRLA